MVVAVASFLFVGCLPETVTPVTPTEPTEPTAAKTDTPYITEINNVSLSSTSTQYTKNPLVSGVGVAGAIIKVYIDDVQSGVGQTGTGGLFTEIDDTMFTLTEGVRVLYVTATQPGLLESDASTKYTFTYDKTAPSIASVIADSTAGTVTVTFDGDVEMATSGTHYIESAMNPLNWAWYNGPGGVDENQLEETTATMNKVSDKVVQITPNATAGVVQTAGTQFYITVKKPGTGTSPTWASVYDVAGNYNSVDISWAGNVVP